MIRGMEAKNCVRYFCTKIAAGAPIVTIRSSCFDPNRGCQVFDDRTLLVGLLKSSSLKRSFIEIDLVRRLLVELLAELPGKKHPRHELRPERMQQEHPLRLGRHGPRGGKGERHRSKPTPQGA